MSKKQNKYKFFKRTSEGDVNNSGVLELESRCRQILLNKYYNIWMSKLEWEGLDEEMKDQQENFIMRKFWSDGTVACRQMDKIGLLVFAPYAAATYNYYDYPETLTLVNLRGASESIIPATVQVVNKDVVIGWCSPNHKPIFDMVRYYVDRMVQIEMVINTNLNLQKMPFLVGVNAEDEQKMKDIVRKILNNELVVFASLEDLQRVQTLSTQTPYIIDKLREHERTLEQELLTYLGVDNNGSQSLEQTHVSVDAVNANNDIINDYGNAIEEEIKKFIERINKVFGRNISVRAVSKPVRSTREHEGGNEND